MKISKQIFLAAIILFSACFQLSLFSASAEAVEDICSEGLGVPPFLASGVTPNVLLIIDNSASMYDPAYDDLAEPGYCNDDSFISDVNNPWVSGTDYKPNDIVNLFVEVTDSAGNKVNKEKWYITKTGGSSTDPPNVDVAIWEEVPTSYAGYFSEKVNYSYALNAEERFEAFDSQSLTLAEYCKTEAAKNDPDDDVYLSDDVCVSVKSSSKPSKVTAFAANGNFLNWAMASKFDIEKSILTGGKYKINPWTTATAYQANAVVEFDEKLYITLTAGTSAGTSPSTDTGITWYDTGVTWDHTGVTWNTVNAWATATPYPAKSVVESNEKLYITIAGGTSAGTSTSNDTGVTWAEMQLDYNFVQESRGCLEKRMIKEVAVTKLPDESYKLTLGVWPGAVANDNITRLEIFEPTTEGFQFANTACEDALLATNQGQASNLAEACLELTQQNASAANSNAAFNHGFQTCWTMYANEQKPYGVVGIGDISRMKDTACGKIYQAGIAPTDLTTKDSGYICMNDPETPYHYIGSCVTDFVGGTPIDPETCKPVQCNWFTTWPDWKPDSNIEAKDGQRCNADGFIEVCPTGYSEKNYQCVLKNVITPFELKQECAEEEEPDPTTYNWVAGADIDLPDETWQDAPAEDGCIERALRAYCDAFYSPDAMDPSRPITSVADDVFPNLPAILTTVAISAQLGPAIDILDGYIKINKTPTGLLQEFSTDLRIGAMKFNAEGSAYECTQDPHHRLYNCAPEDPVINNKDGGRIISYIDQGNTTELVNAINTIPADTWTPMAETMYNAIHYYTQDPTNRLDDYDFFTGPNAAWETGKIYAAGSIIRDNNKWWRTSTGGTSGVNPPPDDDGILWIEINYPPWENDFQYSGYDIVEYNNGGVYELYRTAGGGTSDGETLLNDSGVTWLPYYDPVLTYCQSNNILIITDGAPTTDKNTTVSTFFATHNDGGDDDITDCGSYQKNASGLLEKNLDYVGYDDSTYLDDLTAYANDKEKLAYDPAYNNFVNSQGDPKFKNAISTYVVAAGKLWQDEDAQKPECLPENLLNNTAKNGGTDAFYPSNNPEELSDNLRAVFTKIRAGAAAGSAASVISASRGGEGAIYQAIFWPSLLDGAGNTVTWIGEVHALFIDTYGYMYEDTNQDGQLNLDNYDLEKNDKEVHLFLNENEDPPRTMVCYGSLSNGICDGTTDEMQNIKYLWSANDWLAAIDDVDILTNRDTYISNETKRNIYTWNDLNNNGIVDSAGGEWLEFEPTVTWSALTTSAPRVNTPEHDFNVATDDEANAIVSWIRGLDSASQRSRSYQGMGTWRLGDVIHSTPMAVNKPVEAFHYLYKDYTYRNFAGKYANRRHVIYFGANDGMIHAVNGGFYDATAQKFCLTAACEENPINVPELGAELWAYVPYNLLPHLDCLTKQEYDHKYFVDLRPRIFDVKIFTPEDACSSEDGYLDDNCIHPDGWGTIIVGGMRLGGAPINATDLNNPDSDDDRIFSSSYFIFDITNPENEPILLGEITHTNEQDELSGNDLFATLGYSTPSPTMVTMNDASYSNWYLIIGSGPTYSSKPEQPGLPIEARSDQPPKLAVLPLEWLVAPKSPVRIPNTLPSTDNNEGGIFTLGTQTGLSANYNGFVSDLITVDADLTYFMGDAVYFGTVDCRADCDPNDPLQQPDWGGTMYRLVTRSKTDHDNDPLTPDIQEITTPSEWSTLFPAPMTNPLPLIDVSQPITAAPTAGIDHDELEKSNLWVYFGTGRFFDSKLDKPDASQQSFYGIKEPQDCDREFTWETVNYTTNINHSTTPGSQGLLQVDQIIVEQDVANISCIPDANNPVWGDDYEVNSNDNCTTLINQGVTTFNALKTYTAGDAWSSCDIETDPPETILDLNTGTDGWQRNFLDPRERNVGQAALLGGLLTFTTYQPFSDICETEGTGYLYGLHFQTGTPYYKSVFGDKGVTDEDPPKTRPRISLGRGLASTPNLQVGRGGQGPKAFIQTSTGEIIPVRETNTPIKNFKTGRASWRPYDPNLTTPSGGVCK